MHEIHLEHPTTIASLGTPRRYYTRYMIVTLKSGSILILEMITIKLKCSISTFSTRFYFDFLHFFLIYGFVLRSDKKYHNFDEMIFFLRFLSKISPAVISCILSVLHKYLKSISQKSTPKCPGPCTGQS